MVSESPLLHDASPTGEGWIALLYLALLAVGTLTAVLLLRAGLRRPIAWNSHTAVVQSRPLTWRDSGILLALVLTLLATTVGISWLLKNPTPIVLLLLESLLLDAAGLAVLGGYLRLRGIGWDAAFGLSGGALARSMRLGLIFYLAILPFVFFSSLIYQGILTANGYPPTLQDVAMLLTADNPFWLRIYLIFLAVVLAPAFEECVFRGILFPLLARRWGIGAGIFISSLVFASIHAHLPSLIPLCVVAVGFAMGYLYSGSLWVPIAMHALFNAVNLGLLLMIRD